ncbi:MAG: hypothetical protein E7640_06040, partial [Ruminococcaceae bacterium]|nr:hypothetical protein [Oscillospiraceae bacterium]
MAQKKVTNKKSSQKKQPVIQKKAQPVNAGKRADSKPRSEALIHQILPFVWFFVALFLLFCIIPRDVFGASGDANILGPVGEWIHILSFGLFGWGAFLIPALFVYLGIVWRKLIDEKQLGTKITYAAIIILLISALAEVFVSSNKYLGFELFDKGSKLIGGGLIGGTLGWLSFAGLKIVGSLIVIVALLVIFVCLFLEITPRNIWTWIRYKNKVRQDKKQRLIEQRLNEEERQEQLRIQEEKYAPPVVEESYPEPEQTEDEDEEPELIIEPEPEPEPEPPIEEEKPQSIFDKVIADEKKAQIYANDGDDDAEFEEESEFSMEEPEPEATVIPWVQPPIDLLNSDPGAHADQSENIERTKAKLRGTLESFGVRIRDIGYSIGPTITRYEVFPEAGVRVKQIANLVDDI